MQWTKTNLIAKSLFIFLIFIFYFSFIFNLIILIILTKTICKLTITKLMFNTDRLCVMWSNKILKHIKINWLVCCNHSFCVVKYWNKIQLFYLKYLIVPARSGLNAYSQSCISLSLATWRRMLRCSVHTANVLGAWKPKSVGNYC